MTAERAVYVKVGVKADQALATLRDLKRSLDGIAGQDLGRPRKGLAGLGKVSDSDLRKVRASMDGIAKQDFRRPQSGLDNLFSKANLFGGGLALGIGKAVSSFADFDQQMSAVSAATGVAGDGLTGLRDAAIKAGADTQYSATEAASAITEMSKAGLDATEILGGGLAGALNLAAAGQMDTAEAAETMATALAQFKLDGDKASHVADLLAAGAGKAQGSVSDMGQALKQAGLVADGAGLSIEETVAGLTSFANAGLIGSDAGTSFKSMLQRLTPTSAEAAGLMDELSINAYDAQGNFVGLEKYAGILREGLKNLTPEQRNAAMATIFGSDAVRAAKVLYEQGATGIAHWSEEVNQQGYAAKQAAALTDNLRGDMERLGGAVDTALIQGGSGANDALRSLTKTTEGLVVGLSQIPGPLALGATALAGISVLGPKIGDAAATITGPLQTGLRGFRDEMALHRALATEVVGGYQRLGDESKVASGKVSKSVVAMSAARSTIGGLKGAAGGLMGLFGGPWGIALAGATAAVGFWAQKQADAKQAADALNATIDEQTGKFTKASTESVTSVLMGDLSPDDVKLLEGLGVNFTKLADDMLKGGPAADKARASLVALMDEHQAGLGFLSSEGRATEGLLRSYDRQADAADSARVKQEALNKARNDQAVADSRGADSAATAERNMADLGTAADNAAGSMRNGEGAAADMSGAIKDMGGEAKDAKTELEQLMGFIDSNFGSGERAIRANKRAFDADVRDATEAAREAAKAGGKGYADPDAVKAQKRAQEELDAARAARSKASKTKTKDGKAQDLTQEDDRVKRAEENLADANQRVKDTWHDATKAGEEYRGKLEEVADSGQKQVETLIKQNKPVKDVNKAYDDTRKALREVLKVRGIEGRAAEAEIDRIFGTTEAMDDLRWQYAHTQAQVATQITTPGLPKAKTDMEGYWEVINGIPTFKPTTPTTPGLPKAKTDAEGYWEVINGIPTFKPTTVSVKIEGAEALRTTAALIGSLPGGFGVSAILKAGSLIPQKKAVGGPITGIGTGTSDSNLVLASKGEHMLTAAEVRAAGGHGAIFALRKAIVSGGVAFRAMGGPIAAPVTAYRAAPAALGGFGRMPSAAEIGAAVAAQMPPLVNVHSGADARSAARAAIRDWEWGQVQ
ncbi:MAG: phage tail tape measure protein [Dermatophilaceae bacterium]|nr:phage tail tape measure protein [Dermatophilaceae bacterium]